MILLAMNKILGNLFFFPLASDVQKKETFFRVYFRLSFGVHFNTSSVFSLFRVCVFRVFFLVSLLSGTVCAPRRGWMYYYYYCWYLFRSFFLAALDRVQHACFAAIKPAEESKREERITARKPYYTTHVNG